MKIANLTHWLYMMVVIFGKTTFLQNSVIEELMRRCRRKMLYFYELRLPVAIPYFSFFTESNLMRVVFKSDGEINYRGFVAKFKEGETRGFWLILRNSCLLGCLQD